MTAKQEAESVCICVVQSSIFLCLPFCSGAKSSAHRIWRTLAYVCMLHYALAYQKALLIRISYIAIAAARCCCCCCCCVITLFNVCTVYTAYIYEWNIFAWRSDFPFIFAARAYICREWYICICVCTPCVSPPSVRKKFNSSFTKHTATYSHTRKNWSTSG